MTSGSHHEQQYSLLLDGNSDYLEIGDNLDFGTNDFAISLWFKQDAAATSSELLFSKYQGGNNKVNIVLNSSNKIQANVEGSSNNIFSAAGGTALEGDGGYWIHVVLTCDRDGDTKLYINGTTSTYGTSASSLNSTQNLDNTGSIYIGARSNNDLYFPGKIDEVAVWQAADLSDFDSNAVQAIRNGGDPFDLNYDRGDYHHSASLTGYWRMFNGPFDDLQNGIVHDAHNPGYGADLAVDGGFDTDVAASTTGTYWITSADWVVDNGVATISGTTNNRDLQEATTHLVQTKTYQVNLDVTFSAGTGKIMISSTNFDSNGGSYVTIDSSSGSGNYTVYFRAGSVSAGERFVVRAKNTSGATFTATVDNIVIKQLNGYPGITNATATFSTSTPDD